MSDASNTEPVVKPTNIHATGTRPTAAAEQIETKNIHATGSPADRIITKNIHATTEPADEGDVSTENIHATSEPVK
ncbi:hypothetical protein [Streptomyces sp. NRRL S-118]|uniref:hypothetical protein n=1 Tax=Streptomyces sp. NRRL S-118 TaxID=1463881 RepID=UPI0004C754D1|nr:hypothetical protein [Streptomyces sp. NRRL S-118]